MLDDREPKRSKAHATSTTADSLGLGTNMVAHYGRELDKRKSQLTDDLDYFEAKLRDLEELDPLDFTGLGNVYREHAEQIRSLLDVIDESRP